jgi:hypothetical protein
VYSPLHARREKVWEWTIFCRPCQKELRFATFASREHQRCWHPKPFPLNTRRWAGWVWQWSEWTEWRGRPVDVPSRPDLTYAREGWVSWADWLGYGVGRPPRGTIL